MQVDGSPVARVVLTGEAVGVEGFADALGAELGLPVSEGRVDSEPDGMTPGSLTVASGLAAGGSPVRQRPSARGAPRRRHRRPQRGRRLRRARRSRPRRSC